jgi:hypothetical protein
MFNFKVSKVSHIIIYPRQVKVLKTNHNKDSTILLVLDCVKVISTSTIDWVGQAPFLPATNSCYKVLSVVKMRHLRISTISSTRKCSIIYKAYRNERRYKVRIMVLNATFNNILSYNVVLSFIDGRNRSTRSPASLW